MKVLKKTVNADGSTLAAIDVSGTAGGRSFGIFRVVRLVLIPPGVVYKNSRSKGIRVIEEHEYDQRSKRQIRGAHEEVERWFSQ